MDIEQKRRQIEDADCICIHIEANISIHGGFPNAQKDPIGEMQISFLQKGNERHIIYTCLSDNNNNNITDQMVIKVYTEKDLIIQAMETMTTSPHSFLTGYNMQFDFCYFIQRAICNNINVKEFIQKYNIVGDELKLDIEKLVKCTLQSHSSQPRKIICDLTPFMKEHRSNLPKYHLSTASWPPLTYMMGIQNNNINVQQNSSAVVNHIGIASNGHGAFGQQSNHQSNHQSDKHRNTAVVAANAPLPIIKTLDLLPKEILFLNNVSYSTDSRVDDEARGTICLYQRNVQCCSVLRLYDKWTLNEVFCEFLGIFCNGFGFWSSSVIDQPDILKTIKNPNVLIDEYRSNDPKMPQLQFGVLFIDELKTPKQIKRLYEEKLPFIREVIDTQFHDRFDGQNVYINHFNDINKTKHYSIMCSSSVYNYLFTQFFVSLQPLVLKTSILELIYQHPKSRAAYEKGLQMLDTVNNAMKS
jgi:hypothetical protein